LYLYFIEGFPMARVTTEDCMNYVDNQFDLVLKASKRARDIAYGAQALVEENGDKPTVIALREISEGLLDRDGKIMTDKVIDDES
jgi:DNA-directed RNA polymerase subunit omega